MLHDFEGNSGNSEKYFSPGLLKYSEGEKNNLEWSYYKDRGLEAQKDCKYQMLVKCFRGLI